MTPTYVHGNQATQHALTLGGVKITCSTVEFDGPMIVSPQNGVVLAPTYKNCKALGIAATITNFGGGAGECSMILSAVGSIDIICPTGQEVIIDTVGCTFTIQPQTKAGSLTIASAGTDVAVVFNLSSIAYSVHKAAFCPVSGTSTAARTDGTYTGSSTFVAAAGTFSLDL